MERRLKKVNPAFILGLGSNTHPLSKWEQAECNRVRFCAPRSRISRTNTKKSSKIISKMGDFENIGLKNWGYILKNGGFLMSKQLLTEKEIKSAEAVLAKGDRVELIPVKDGVRVIRVKREEVKK